MPSGGSTQVRSDGFGNGLHAKLVAVRAQCAVLNETCAQSQQTAVLAQQESARLLVQSRRSRGELLRVWLPPDASCGAVARRLVEEHLGSASVDELKDARIVVSELVNNAFLHGKGGIELRLSARRGRARIAVTDQGKGAVIRAGQHDRHHGLDIVGALSLAWGARAGSTHVWAELPARGPRPIAHRGIDSA